MATKRQIKLVWNKLKDLLEIQVSLSTVMKELSEIYRQNKHLSKVDLKKKMLQRIVDKELLGTELGKEVTREILNETVTVDRVTDSDLAILDREAEAFLSEHSKKYELLLEREKQMEIEIERRIKMEAEISVKMEDFYRNPAAMKNFLIR